MSERNVGMKLFLIVALLVFGTVIPAHATEVTQFTWDRTGAEHLPCQGDAEWVLAGEGITNATVGINDNDGEPDGHAWAMLWDGSSWGITSTEPVAADDEVLVAYLGVSEAPRLSLVDCESGPVSSPLPTTNSEPTSPPESPTTPALTSWSIGFKVTTIRRTNVLAKWRIVCDGVLTRGKVRGMTPLSRTFTGFEGATTCHITVRAYDIKPHVRPHNWPAPVVTTWVNHS
jgi:hypothetical protein